MSLEDKGMPDNLPLIWINVTTSVNWQRPPVGIVRVERSLCSELRKLYGNRFKMCVWEDGRFVEWVPPQAGPQRPMCSEQGVAQRVSTPSPLMFPILPRKVALRLLVQSLLSLLPSSLKVYFNRFLYFIRPYAVKILSSERRRHPFKRMFSGYHSIFKIGSRRAGDRASDSSRKEIFNSGDVLISIGLDWDGDITKNFFFLKKRLGIKVVTCCYDLIPVLYPQYCVGDVASKFMSYFLDLADASDLILCISNQSQRDLLDMLHRTGGAVPQTHVFPLGDNVSLSRVGEISPEISGICKQPFIIFVSTIERRKNHEVLYRAYHLLCSQGRGANLPKLVFVGMPGWGVDELLKDIELDPLTQGMIVQLNHVSDSELRLLYEAALFCVFPSLYEGWGLPVAEALSFGKAVISSNRGSLPEVGGELVRYVDPWDLHKWADEIYQMATDDVWRRGWEKKAQNEYKKRTWDESARSIFSVLQRDVLQVKSDIPGGL